VNDTAPAPGEETSPPLAADCGRRRRRQAGVLKPDRVFLVLGSLFGLAFLVLTPPFQVPDEDAHFYRSVEISEGHLVARKEGNYTGDEVPAAVKALVTRYAPLAMTADQKTTVRDVLESA
jgi:hypothetical protein